MTSEYQLYFLEGFHISRKFKVESPVRKEIQTIQTILQLELCSSTSNYWSQLGQLDLEHK